LNPDIRGEAETYPDFHARRKRNRARADSYLRGHLFWDSRANGAIERVDADTYKKHEQWNPFSGRGVRL